MVRRYRRELPFRLGCPLALLLAIGGAAMVEMLARGRLFHAGEWDFPLLVAACIGLPFAALAFVKTRDWLAWLLAGGLTAGLWIGLFHDSRGGMNFMAGVAMVVAPLLIAGLCLAVAGMRGRIAWAREGKDSGVED